MAQALDGSTDLQRALELATLTESASDAVIGMSPTGQITSWSDGAVRLYGYSRAEAVGKHITMLTPADRKQEARSISETMAKGDRVECLETERVAKDGRLLKVKLSISPVWDEEGERAGSVGICPTSAISARLKTLCARASGAITRSWTLSARAW